MQDVDDIEMAARASLVGVAKEDRVIAEGDAAIVGAQLRPWAANHGRQCGNVLAVVGYASDEGISGGATLSLSFDVGRYFGDAPPRRGTIDEAWHLGALRRLPECVEVIARVTAHVVSREASAFGLRSVERAAQCRPLGLPDGMPHGILRRRKGSGGDLGPHPFCGVGSEFDFQGEVLRSSTAKNNTKCGGGG